MHRACAPAGPSTAQQHLLWQLAAAAAAEEAAGKAEAAAAEVQAEPGLASAGAGRHWTTGVEAGTWCLAAR